MNMESHPRLLACVCCSADLICAARLAGRAHSSPVPASAMPAPARVLGLLVAALALCVPPCAAAARIRRRAEARQLACDTVAAALDKLDAACRGAAGASRLSDHEYATLLRAHGALDAADAAQATGEARGGGDAAERPELPCAEDASIARRLREYGGEGVPLSALPESKHDSAVKTQYSGAASEDGDESALLEVGSIKIEGVEVKDRLGGGGFGVVYQAEVRTGAEGVRGAETHWVPGRPADGTEVVVKAFKANDDAQQITDVCSGLAEVAEGAETVRFARCLGWSQLPADGSGNGCVHSSEQRFRGWANPHARCTLSQRSHTGCHL